MKHQIVFVGGQVLPIVIGLREFPSEKVHFIVSDESKSKLALIKPFLNGISFSEVVCDPFDIASIIQNCERILNKLEESDTVLLNLTSGTKIMVLAAQSLIISRKLEGFYVNQNDTILLLPSHHLRKIEHDISIVEFLAVSGHQLIANKTVNDFTKDDFSSAQKVDSFASGYDRVFYQLNSKIKKSYRNTDQIPLTGKIELSNGVVSWTKDVLSIEINSRVVLKLQSSMLKNLFFNSTWWELLVAQEVAKWSKAKELFIQCELPFKGDKEHKKNEIDILVNLGRQLIFIECKSGNIIQDDINKMKIVKDTYGGIISKSILVSRFIPNPNILEKCKELNIDVFYCFMGKTQVNPLNKLIQALEKVEKKLMI